MVDNTFIQKVADSIIDLNTFGTRKFAKYLLYFLIQKPKEKLTVKTLHEFVMTIHPAQDKAGVEHEIYYKGTYEKGTLNLVKQLLAKNNNMLDIGANIGFVSLYASTVVGPNGRILSFEANPETVPLLEENIKINSFNYYESFIFDNGKDRISKLQKITTTEQLPFHDNVVCISKNRLSSLNPSIFA